MDIIPENCATGYDRLTPADLRILELRRLLVGLHEFHLADRVCDEYGVTIADLRILAHLEGVLREAQREETDGGSPDHSPG